jgi:hypothetical protein
VFPIETDGLRRLSRKALILPKPLHTPGKNVEAGNAFCFRPDPDIPARIHLKTVRRRAAQGGNALPLNTGLPALSEK